MTNNCTHSIHLTIILLPFVAHNNYTLENKGLDMDHIKAPYCTIHYITLLTTLIVSLLLPHFAHASWYVGIDKTTFDYVVQVERGDLDYELDSTRFKTGYTSKGGLGFEFQYYGTADNAGTVNIHDPNDTREFTTTGSFSSPWGAHVTLTSDHEHFGLYGALGFIYIDSEVSATLVQTGQTVDDRDDLSLHGITLGAYYKITKKLNVSVEYSSYDGEVTYDNLTDTSVNPDGFLDVDLSSVSFGLGYRF